MLQWTTLRLILHRGIETRTSRFLPQRRASSRRSLRRGALLAELDRFPVDKRTTVMVVMDELSRTTETSSAALSSSQDLLHNGSEKIDLCCENTVVDEDLLPQDVSLVAGSKRDVNLRPQLPSLDMLRSQQAALRTMFNDSKRNCIRMKKDFKCLREERRVFQLSHGRAPSNTEVSPFVDIELSPVAALKLTKYLSSHSSAREAVVQSILLQQNITRNKLVQSGEKTLFRCLSCFHVYAAHSRNLLRDEVGHSWMQYEAERAKVNRARELARRPQLRKHRYSVGRQREAFEGNPRCCPSCGSAKAQWLMEYVHHRTHA